jgi:hypothetical protein
MYGRRMKWLALMFMVAACGGPSNTEIKTAKSAHYKAEPQTLMQIAMQVAERDYKIGEVDEAGARFATKAQIYSAEGGRQSPGAGGYVQMDSNSIMLSLIVEVVAAQPGNVVVVTPKTFQMVPGSPKPRELQPDDPNVPGWVHGRVDSLAVDIHAAAKDHVAY